VPIAQLDRAPDYECEMGRLDSIFIYLSCLMISIKNLRLMNHVAVVDK